MLVGHVGRITPEVIGGWAADTGALDEFVDVIIYVDGKRAARITCDRLREDLRDLGVYGEGRHGFEYRMSPPLPFHLLDRVAVRFAGTGETLPEGERAVRAARTMGAILVTAPGRSGTTLMMQRLSRSPQVCVAEVHPYEVRLISYWCTAVSTLTGPADHERSMHPDKLEGDGLKVGANPFCHQNYAAVFKTANVAAEYFCKYVPQYLNDVARTTINEYYLRLKDDRAKGDAVYFAEKNNNLDRRVRIFARTLYPNLKEIVLVRDPRDLLCSQIAYFRRDPEIVLHQITHATTELMRIKRDEAEKVLFVSYEDLILKRETVDEEVTLYLGTDLDSGACQDEERASFGSHSTSESPIASVGRWTSQLTDEQRRWCNDSWGEFLDAFGYD